MQTGRDRRQGYELFLIPHDELRIAHVIQEAEISSGLDFGMAPISHDLERPYHHPSIRNLMHFSHVPYPNCLGLVRREADPSLPLSRWLWHFSLDDTN
jgi:hypothetical protein